MGSETGSPSAESLGLILIGVAQGLQSLIPARLSISIIILALRKKKCQKQNVEHAYQESDEEDQDLSA